MPSLLHVQYEIYHQHYLERFTVTTPSTSSHLSVLHNMLQMKIELKTLTLPNQPPSFSKGDLTHNSYSTEMHFQAQTNMMDRNDTNYG